MKNRFGSVLVVFAVASFLLATPTAAKNGNGRSVASAEEGSAGATFYSNIPPGKGVITPTPAPPSLPQATFSFSTYWKKVTRISGSAADMEEGAIATYGVADDPNVTGDLRIFSLYARVPAGFHQVGVTPEGKPVVTLSGNFAEIPAGDLYIVECDEDPITPGHVFCTSRGLSALKTNTPEVKLVLLKVYPYGSIEFPTKENPVVLRDPETSAKFRIRNSRMVEGLADIQGNFLDLSPWWFSPGGAWTPSAYVSIGTFESLNYPKGVRPSFLRFPSIEEIPQCGEKGGTSPVSGEASGVAEGSVTKSLAMAAWREQVAALEKETGRKFPIPYIPE